MLKAAADGLDARLQVRGYEEPADAQGMDELADDDAQDALSRIADRFTGRGIMRLARSSTLSGRNVRRLRLNAGQVPAP